MGQRRLRFKGIAADQAMRPELEYIADPRDRDGANVRLERPLLRRLRLVLHQNLVDLADRKDGQFDRHFVIKEELFDLKLQILEAPFAPFLAAVEAKAESSRLGLGQVGARSRACRMR